MQSYRSYFTCKLAFILLVIIPFLLPAQGTQALDSESFWKEIPEQSRASKTDRLVHPLKSRLIKIETEKISNSFVSIAGNSEAKEISLPLPNGTQERFMIRKYDIMESALKTRFSQIHTWTGVGIDRPELSVKLDLSHKGFHALILGGGASVYIDPYSKSNKNQYVSYFKKDYQTDQPYLELDPIEVTQNKKAIKINKIPVEADGNFRTYRLAVATTGEYSAFHGGTTNDVMAAIVTTINRVNGIYERDLALRMVLVNDNDQLIFLDGTTDPFSNNNANNLITQSQNTIDAIIGNANYDIGHTFSTGGGGLAGLGAVCFTGYKGQGVTGRGNPIGDPFDVDYVAHEMGHQFGAHHTFNGNGGSCGSNRHGPTAFEPGSGSTIMAYAGICSGQNLQSNSDAYFHSASLNEIILYTTIGWGSSCATQISTTNQAPVVDAGADYIIPQSTPFALEANGSDADGDGLTYTWEQIDLGLAGSLDDPSRTDGPIFRSFPPTPNPNRTFPQLSDILTNTQTTGEVLPETDRFLSFQVTARDNNPDGGRIGVDTAIIEVKQQAGPFVITNPGAATWGGGGSQTITWDVAGTDLAPISCLEVDIFLSDDGGMTFSHTLASNISNNGTATIQVPNINTSQGRIKVKAANNIFFDISDQNLTINQNISEPIVNNPVFSTVTKNEAALGADVVSDGGSVITERGVIWSLQNNPEIGNTGVTKVIEGGTSLGPFGVNVNGLPAGSTIYFRGYATNSQGTGYTQTETFQTQDGRVSVRFKTLDFTVKEVDAVGSDCRKIYELELEIEVTEPPLATVSVDIVSGGDAQEGLDYRIITPNPIIFNAGSISTKNIKVNVYDDGEKEVEESVELKLIIADTSIASPGPKATIKIIDNDRDPEISTEISESTGSSEIAHLKPKALIHFFDQNTGKLMATIQNMGEYDFGCTWIEIDRAGMGTIPFWEFTADNRKDLMEKTFFIHTEHNQPTNDYEVTLYYSEDEVNGWINQTGGNLSWDSLQMALSPGQIQNITPNQPEPDGPVNITQSRIIGSVGKGFGVAAIFNQSTGGIGVGRIGRQENFINFISGEGFYNPQEKVNLTWVTKGETRVSNFDLIRIEPNGKSEELIVALPAAGNSFQEESYDYRDEYDVDDFVQYLVRANFEDGSSALSDTILVEPEELIANIYPNPFTDQLNIFVEGDGEAQVIITAATVGLIHTYRWNLDESLTGTIDLSQLSPGLYFYSVMNKGTIKGGTLLKL